LLWERRAYGSSLRRAGRRRQCCQCGARRIVEPPAPRRGTINYYCNDNGSTVCV